MPHTILVTGGAGYVGSDLVPKLLAAGHAVRVLDLFLYGTPEEIFPDVAHHPRLVHFKGDLRDPDILRRALDSADTVIHLACISNDPSFDLDPTLGKSINYDAFLPLVRQSKSARVRRFIFASSSSVYGVKNEPEVTEDLALEPITDYGKYKALCEKALWEEIAPGEMVAVAVRPASLYGYAPRLRLDLTINMLTLQALENKKITIHGGAQKRPNLSVHDMSDLYVRLLDEDKERIDRQVFNVNAENATVQSIAERIAAVVGNVALAYTDTKDLRSYHTSTKKIERALGWRPKQSIEDGVRELIAAYRAGKIPNPMHDDRYYNVRRMKHLQLK